MHELTLITACCGGDSGLDGYAEFLRRKLDGRVQVDLLALGSCSDIGAIPPALRQRLAGQRIDGVPIVVLDGTVVASGPLPNWMDSLEAIEAAMQAQARAS